MAESEVSRDVVSMAGVCETEVVAGPKARAAAPPDLLIEIPHGATTGDHYAEVRRLLSGELPDDLEAFYFVNTDVGAPECARALASLLTGQTKDGELKGAPAVPVPGGRDDLKVMIVRSLIPRTFIDCNRVLEAPLGELSETGLTRGLPGYVVDDADVETLTTLHRAYQEVADQAYELVCGAGGRAVALHTFAPRSVGIERVDAGIVAALRAAYEPERYRSWPERPPVDLITEADDGTVLAPAGLVASIVEQYRGIGIEAALSATYRLHPATTGYLHSARFPAQVVCVEIRRDQLADPFTPFVPVRISRAKAFRMAGPLAAALSVELAPRSPRRGPCPRPE